MTAGSHSWGGRRRIALAVTVLAFLLPGLAANVAQAREAYVANEDSGTVSAIDTATDSVLGTPIATGLGSGTIAITPDGKRAYVANHLADSVSVIDTATDNVLGAPVVVGTGPRGIAISPDGSKVYVANEGSSTVSVIDTDSNTVETTIAMGGAARGIAISPDGAKAYVGIQSTEEVLVIDLASGTVVGDPIEVGLNPQGIAFTPDGSKAYVANLASGSVSVIDTASEAVTATILVGSSPVGVAISPDGERAYVANYGSETVSVIDTASDATVGDPIELDERPRWVAITPDGDKAYVATGWSALASGNVSVIDTASATVVGDPIEVGSSPLGVAVVPDQPPLASLASATGNVGRALRLDASASSDPDGQIARYDWDFGDGRTAPDAGPTSTHTYSAAGIYRVTVTLTDSEGCSTSFVFTGVTAFCNGSTLASATSTVEVVEPKPAPLPIKQTPPMVPGPSNAFHLDKLHRDKRRGIAKLEVWFPGPGSLLLRGKPVRTVKRTVAGARTLTLVVRPQRQEMKALKRRGHLKVRVEITFHPDGGVPRTLARQLELVRTGGR